MRLTTARLLLRDFTGDDWPAVLAYQSEPQYLQYYPWTERTPEDVRQFVDRFIAQQSETPRTRYQLAVVLRATGELIGNCGIRLRSVGALEADIGYEVAPAHWGQGYATEAARAVVHFGFTRLGLHRIAAWCIADNVASARVLEKVGMRREGWLRENERFKGRWWDTLLYAVLDREWPARPAP